MTLEELEDHWNIDCKIDTTELANEASKVPELHHKYYKIYNREKLILRRSLKDLELLRHEKYEFFTTGETRETRDKGWVFPGKKLKAEVWSYVDTDKQIVDLTLKIDLYTQKVSFLEDILKMIHGRSFLLSSAIKWNLFVAGQ